MSVVCPECGSPDPDERLWLKAADPTLRFPERPCRNDDFHRTVGVVLDKRPDSNDEFYARAPEQQWAEDDHAGSYDDADLGWWAISGHAVLNMLNRVAAGESPDIVYAEEYANSQHENVEGSS